MDPSDPIRYFQVCDGLEPFWMTSSMKPFQVTIAQVYTPGQFYIQLQSNVNALQDLLNDLK